MPSDALPTKEDWNSPQQIARWAFFRAMVRGAYRETTEITSVIDRMAPYERGEFPGGVLYLLTQIREQLAAAMIELGIHA